QFEGQIYHQVHGTAMGSPMAPCYANVFLYYLEKQWLDIHNNHILFYRRYLDDVFGVMWTTATEAKTILDSFSSLHPDMKLKYELDSKSVNFLDLKIFKGDRFRQFHIFDLSVYTKSMNKFLYIPFASYHSKAMKKAFIKAELIRYVRNSSSLISFQE